MKNSIRVCISIFILAAISSCGTPDYAKMIIGKWEFYQFYSKENLSAARKDDLKTFNKSNKGLTIRFSPMGQYESDQPGGVKENNSITDYKVVDNMLLIEGDAIQILEVSERFLRLHKDENSPDVMFKRINFTGTEPGRQ
ncbi:hypothetical protein L0U88_13515 [Flavihumibacter sp. RY-1]|uniref:Lipocalin-like protein n=1 Tax=Flavihumibacter fluminis TaxID=2909236 RepID=A0ABS9BKB9_9BACT|nr:hypothetical protein [Flavihumibacter fluminis]MCF1715650.1 hypothetical protein [Flavihumibacter fluminis]